MRQDGYLARNGRWLGAGALLTLLSSFGQTFFISIFAGEIRETFGLSVGQWGGIYTLGTGLSALTMVWAGTLTDRYRVRALGPVVLVGLALACLAMAVNVWAGGLVGVVFALRLFGQGMCSHLAVVAMARWFDATRGRALSIAALGFRFGEAVLPVGFVALMPLVGWRPLWAFAAAVSALAVWPLLALLRAERTPQAHARETRSTGMDGRHWTRGEAVGNPVFWLMIPAVFAPSAFHTAFFFHQVYLADLRGWAHMDLVRLFPLYSAISVLSMIGAGWLLDQLGAVRLMAATQVPILIAFVVFADAQTSGMMMLGLAGLAVSGGMLSTIPSAFWAEAYGTAHIGAIKAFAAAAMVLGSALGPGATGTLIDRGFDLDRQFLVIAGVFAASTLLAAMGAARVRRRLAAPLSGSA